MKKHDYFPVKWLKAADIDDREMVMTVQQVVLEEVGIEREERCVLYFRGTTKAMILNSTNYNTIAAVLGSDETDDWVGREITLRTELVSFRGATNPAIRVKPAKPVGPVHAPARRVQALNADNDVDTDELPF